MRVFRYLQRLRRRFHGQGRQVHLVQHELQRSEEGSEEQQGSKSVSPCRQTG